ncbi:MAG: serine/threonine-protein kinase [Rhodospirillales bacterium]|nr:serine/threonine-protein kinase [Rhodospirillales bacterium]
MAETTESQANGVPAQEAPGGAPASAAPAANTAFVPGGPVLLDERYQIEPSRPVPDFDMPSAPAFHVEDRRDTGRHLLASICNPGLPPRAEVMPQLKGGHVKGIVPLVEWGPVDWPTLGERCMAVIYERPAGGRLAPNFSADGANFTELEIRGLIVEPIAATLRRLESRDLAHRSIRPNNLFFMDEARQDLVLGDAVTCPPGFDQPLIFETIERGMASQGGRGEGGASEDLYALGVSLVFLILGRNPLERLSEDALLAVKAEQGTFAALCSRERIPTPFIELLRGLTSDDALERWDLERLENWITGTRMTPVQRKPIAKSADELLFDGREHFTPRTLAHAFGQNTTEALPVVKEGRLDHWIRRSMGNGKLADLVSEAIKDIQGPDPSAPCDDDLLITKICSLLDPLGPVRYRGFAFMPDGFGPALALEILRRGEAQIPIEAVLRDIPALWFAAQRSLQLGPGVVEGSFARQRANFQSPEIGYGIERCLYELNPGLPCQSQLVIQDYVADVEDLLPALNDAANRVDGKTSPIDRHIAAFIAARMEQDTSAYLAALADSDPKTSSVGLLSILALLQWRLNTGPVFNLTSWVGGLLGPAISSYHSRTTRRALEREIPRLIRQGSLADIYDFIDNREKRRADENGFSDAVAQYEATNVEIERIESSDAARAETAETIGQQISAMSSVLITLIVITILVLVETY